MVETLSLILSAVTLIYLFQKNKEKINQLSFAQILAVCITFLIFIGIATTLIYVGGNWIVDEINSEWISTVVLYGIILVVLGAVIVSLDKVVGKITNKSESAS